MKDIFAIDPFWQLTEAVSLQEAAALIAGYDPHQLALTVGEIDVHPTYSKFQVLSSELDLVWQICTSDLIGAEAHRPAAVSSPTLKSWG